MIPNIRIAIDGPAGVGKTTVAKIVAKRLNIDYVDTGAMYRAVAYKILKESIPLKDIKKVLNNLKLEVKNNRIYLAGEDITKKIRAKPVSDIVSDIAKIKFVRDKLRKLQKKIAAENNVVMEGRDIGTVIMPKCKYKFYLDAKLSERIKRRMKDYKNVNLKEVKSEIISRDIKDTTRKIAPLRRAKDAIYIDTTNLSANEVAEKILSFIQNKNKILVNRRQNQHHLKPTSKQNSVQCYK